MPTGLEWSLVSSSEIFPCLPLREQLSLFFNQLLINWLEILFLYRCVRLLHRALVDVFSSSISRQANHLSHLDMLRSSTEAATSAK